MAKCNCIGCKKKLKLVDLEIKCKCGKSFCKLHKDPTLHKCEYNYKTIDQTKLINEMKCDNKKLIMI